MKITSRLDHYAIAAADTSAMAKWYHRVLGLEIHAEAGPKPPGTQKTYLIGPPVAVGANPLHQGMMIEVMPMSATPRQGRHALDPGLSHTAWYVADFDAALAHLKACEVKFLSEVITAVGGGRIISFEDCESNMTQIVERL